ncbi:DUF6580 family putative transport protein [Georgenia phoenicis]|uniref:DUF6580 family putative transport protein n=1 Tax=unclassified Georgenia TaxID=2626815 RepID=UPI0039AEE995
MHTVLKYAVVALLAVASVAWRDYNLNTFLAPGVELVTVLAVVSAILLPRTLAIAVPLLTVAVGDVLLGSHSVIFLYVWGAWVAIAAGALVMRRARSARSTALVGMGVGAGSSTLFFLVTNFGTWMLGRGEWVADSAAGLLSTYVMGLPFYLYPLLANVVLVPAAAVAAHALRAYQDAPAPALQPAR